MAIRDLIPWRKHRRGEEALATREDARDVFQEMMEDFFRPGGLTSWARREPALSPAFDVSETDDEYRVSMELPGLAKDDIEVSIENGRLTISGEKKEEQKEEKENFLRVERSYGSFTRSVPLPGTVNEEGIEASFKDGVLSVRLPKTEEARGKKVEIKGA